MQIVDLKCERMKDPMGIDALAPLLSWRLEDDGQGKYQKAYRIMVATSYEKLINDVADLWDSQKVFDDESIGIVYGGKSLNSGVKCFWKVCVWDEEDIMSDFSEIRYWEMGLLEDSSWQGRWIIEGEKWIPGWAPLFRKCFHIERKMKYARVYISGLGYYELYFNGMKVGDRVLEPAQTDYTKRILYSAYDITEAVQEGENAIGVILGDGWYNQNRVWASADGKSLSYGQPCLLVQINLYYEDGSMNSIFSDDTWKSSRSPITMNNVYAGETYDARLEQEGWNQIGFDDSSWAKTRAIQSPGGKMKTQMIAPVRKVKRMRPVKMTKVKEGIYVYDMGQNFSGWVSIKARGPQGAEITLRFAEETGLEGMPDPATTGIMHTHVFQTDRYILKGGGNGTETWEPRFTYHGFRYVELTGYFGASPDIDTLEGVVVHTDLEQIGSFFCSDVMFNRIHEAIKWTQLTNLHGYPEDCPARERCGWLGDAHIVAETMAYNWDSFNFMEKYLWDMATTYELNGQWTNIAPGKRSCGVANPDWSVAQVLIPWNLYLYYGDKKVLKDHYDGMKAWFEYWSERSDSYIIPTGFGDWCSPGGNRNNLKRTPVAITSTAYFYLSASVMQKTAYALQKVDEADIFGKKALKIKVSFIHHFFNQEKCSYGSQTADSMALVFGLIPTGKEGAVAASLVENIVKENSGHFTTGIMGLKFMFNALCEQGHGTIAQMVLDQTTAPSFGHNFLKGATTLWETWEDYPLNPGSHNHPMNGGLGSWFYSHLAGICPDENKPGFKHIILKPHIIGDLSFVKVKYLCPYGWIESNWKRNAGKLTVEIAIPVNTTATLYLPSKTDSDIEINGSLPDHIKGVQRIEQSDNQYVYLIEPGKYCFDAVE